MNRYEITSPEDVDQAAADVILAGLLAFNEGHAGPAHSKKVQLILRDADGVVRGGLLGRHAWGWLLPVGTVCIAVSTEESSRVRTFRFRGERAYVKRQASQTALDMLRRMLDDRG